MLEEMELMLGEQLGEIDRLVQMFPGQGYIHASVNTGLITTDRARKGPTCMRPYYYGGALGLLVDVFLFQSYAMPECGLWD